MGISWQGLGDQEPSWGTSNTGDWQSVGLSGISSISKQFSFHSAAKEEEEDDLDVEDDDDDSEEDISKSFFSAGFAWITILMNFVGLSFSAELLTSGRSFFKISSPIFTFFSLSLSWSLSSSKVPVETFLPTGDGDALRKRAYNFMVKFKYLNLSLKDLPDLV